MITSARLAGPSTIDTWRVLHATPYTNRRLLQTQVEPEIHPSHVPGYTAAVTIVFCRFFFLTYFGQVTYSIMTMPTRYSHTMPINTTQLTKLRSRSFEKARFHGSKYQQARGAPQASGSGESRADEKKRKIKSRKEKKIW